MGIFRQFPYSNFHEMNMDEIIKIVKQLAEEWLAYQQKYQHLYDDINTAFTAFKHDFDDFVEGCDADFRAFMNSINVDQEFRQALQTLVTDGTFESVVAPIAATQTTNWLNTHITNPTNPPLDTSLTVSGSAADAKAAGDMIRLNRNAIHDTDLSNTMELANTIIWETGGISWGHGGNVVSNARIRTQGFLPANCEIFWVPIQTRFFYVYAYDLNNVFAGAMKDYDTFVSDGSDSAWNYVNFSKLRILHPHLRFRVSVIARNSDTVQPNYAEIKTYKMTSTTGNTHYTANALTNLAATRNLNTRYFWEHGTITDATGEYRPHEQRMVTKTYLPMNTAQINVPDTMRFFLYAYDLEDNYIGGYRTDGSFVTDGSNNGFYTLITAEIFSEHPNYRYKIFVTKQDGTEITQTDLLQFELKNTIYNPVTKLKVMQYNIGKYNYGHEGGLSTDVAQKVLNYKRFFAKEHPDLLFLQESTEYIDAEQQYNTDANLYNPLFRYTSLEDRETAIKSQTVQQLTRFSYIHTSGDPSAWVIYGTSMIDNKEVTIVSGVLNTTSNTEQKIRALTKLTEQLIGDVRFAIIGMDTNCNTQAEVNAVKAFMASKGYTYGNWGYVGNIRTYKESWLGYGNIDNIFVKGGNIVNFERYDVYNDLSSDHYPVKADVILY